MADDLEVIVAGLAMYGRPGRGPFCIVKDGLDGWDGGVLRGDKIARPQSHGSYALQRFQESRTVTVTGIILADSLAELENLGSRLTGVLAGGEMGTVQVRRGGNTQWALASLDSCSVDPRHGQTRSDFQMQLWFPNPRKFGESRTFTAAVGAPVNVYHRGNFPAIPGAAGGVIIRGDLPGGYTLTVNGWDYRVTRPLVTGAPHRINYNTNQLKVNGTVVQNSPGNTNLTTIPPGPAVAVGLYPVTTGTGTADIEVVDTYI